MSTMSRPSL
ncbi:hypothetical protein E2C01_082451 [Portunus trituberculatus]|uniref:Uncharacterized protein n=1 Tax=Portunus trituberculatus TaxID=210409 RepID=A0A5B7IYJ0_PORTR|nr:hypothetical protein [Portunus trituberculatus]